MKDLRVVEGDCDGVGGEGCDAAMIAEFADGDKGVGCG